MQEDETRRNESLLFCLKLLFSRKNEVERREREG